MPNKRPEHLNVVKDVQKLDPTVIKSAVTLERDRDAMNKKADNLVNDPESKIAETITTNLDGAIFEECKDQTVTSLSTEAASSNDGKIIESKEAVLLDLNPNRKHKVISKPAGIASTSYFSQITKQTAAITESAIQYINKPKEKLTQNGPNRILPSVEDLGSIQTKPIPMPLQMYLNDSINSISLRTSHSLASFYKLMQPILNIFQSYFVKPKAPMTIPRVKSILVIGIHGWFQGPLLQRITGQPTGTSSRFTQKMAEAIPSFFATIQEKPPKVFQLPLESEGLIEERIDTMMAEIQAKHMSKFNVELVVITTHSQGCPVSTLLLEKLISKQIVQPQHQQVAMLCMASITHGPFPFLKSNIVVQYVEKEAARQLFEFCSGSSLISRMYMRALYKALETGVRIVAVGSWYDQVVPLYSSTMHAVQHENLFRAIHINGSDYLPDFLSRLVVFALKLRNMGIDDRDLILYLSEYVAGNIWSGTQGHSTVYEDEGVYKLVLRWALDPHFHDRLLRQKYEKEKLTSHWIKWFKENHPTIYSYAEKKFQTPAATILVPKQKPFEAPSKVNAYNLPWIMAHLVQDERIVNNYSLKQELDDLIDLFRRWNPVGAKEKELKHQLQGLKSKL